MSKIRIKDIGKDISLTPIEIIMRDEKPEMINETSSTLFYIQLMVLTGF